MTVSHIPNHRIIGDFQRGELRFDDAAIEQRKRDLAYILQITADGQPWMIVLDHLYEHSEDGEFLSEQFLRYLVEHRPNCIAHIGTYNHGLYGVAIPDVGPRELDDNPHNYSVRRARPDGLTEAELLQSSGHPADFIEQVVRAREQLNARSVHTVVPPPPPVPPSRY